MFSLNLALREPPRYAAAEQRPELNGAFMVILGLERMDQFHEMVAAHERGEIPPPIMWGACPTLFDPGQAPPGRHTAFMWEKLPYALHGDARNWDAEQEAHGRAMLAHWARFAPNLAEGGAVLDAFTRSPLDTERTLPNMCRGDLLVGSLSARAGRLPQAVPRGRSVSDPRRRPLPVWRVDASGGQHHRLVRLQRRRGARLRSGPGPVVGPSAGGACLASSMRPRSLWIRLVPMEDILLHRAAMAMCGIESGSSTRVVRYDGCDPASDAVDYERCASRGRRRLNPPRADGGGRRSGR